MLVYLNGISSSGKSVISNELLKHLDNAIVIDQDTFYKKDKPMVTFEGDNRTYTAANWDTAESIDFDQFNNKIKEAWKSKDYDYVIVTGFALRDQYMTKEADVSILLNIGDDLVNKVSKVRQTSKGYKGDKAIKDYYMVKNVVIPYYEETLKNISYDYVVDVYEADKRVALNILTDTILKYIHWETVKYIFGHELPLPHFCTKLVLPQSKNCKLINNDYKIQWHNISCLIDDSGVTIYNHLDKEDIFVKHGDQVIIYLKNLYNTLSYQF